MCGIAGFFGPSWNIDDLKAAISSQRHRGPDDEGLYINESQKVGLGHNRLSILDLSSLGHQPMCSADRRLWIVFNGEIYNYLELRDELSSYPFRSRTDTEVVLAAYERWGQECLQHFTGMFAFLLWDEREQRLFAARDRFGVKPFYYHQAADGTLVLASEIKALHAAGIPMKPNAATWATYLALGLYEHSKQTFWEGIDPLPAGHSLTWHSGRVRITQWYDLAARIGDQLDERPEEVVEEEYYAALVKSVKLRFRSDVPVGINLSGGLDSSTLLGLVQAVQGPESDVKAFTFATGDPAYDELPWVEQMLAHTRHPSVVCKLAPSEVPRLAEAVQASQDEPFGGLPTLAYARLFEVARAQGVIVLLDGQGMDEQWAGYDYYRDAVSGHGREAGLIQGTRESPVRPTCLRPEFLSLARSFQVPRRFKDRLRNIQYRDIRYTKIPRALRFNDRVSMRSSTELRDPFLDHTLFELALKQPPDRKIRGCTSKWLLRSVASRRLPLRVIEAPKRPIQTPQREWLRTSLREWANDHIQTALTHFGGTWLDSENVLFEWTKFCRGESDNSFYVWQWLTLGLMLPGRAPSPSRPDDRQKIRLG